MSALREIYRGMSRQRRRHLLLLIGLIFLGSIFELFTIGAVIPFLALLAGLDKAHQLIPVSDMLSSIGLHRGDHQLFAAALFLAAAAIIGAIVRLALLWSSQKFAFQLGHDLGVKIYSRMLRQPYSFYVQRNTSEVIAGIEKVQGVIFSVMLPAIQAVISAIMALFIVALLVAIDPTTAAVAFIVMALVYLAVSFVSSKVLRQNSQVIADMQTRRVQQVQEGLGGIRDILIDQSQAVFESNFQRFDKRLRDAQTVNAFISNAPRLIVEASGIILISMLALYLNAQAGGLIGALPVLGALALGAQRLLPLVQIVYVGWSSYSGAVYLLFDVVELMRYPIVETARRDRSAQPRPFERDISFDRVSFHYTSGDRPALSDVDLTIGKGERIGLIGRTGSGKSTLLDLLMGLLAPTDGTIRVDGVPLDDVSLGDWQAQIAHVPQFIYLSDSSIASNIAFGEADADIDIERVRAAAASAHIAEFIDRLPKGYETPVGERGVRLSGGQRQRIGIARALYKRANVLIFDEATSALDDETEAAVMNGLSGMGRELTLVIVAHRLSTLADCERLVRLEGGKIAEIGTYEELVGGRRTGKAISTR